MSATSSSQFIEVLIAPKGSDGLVFSVQSEQLPLAALSGQKRIRVSLTQGSFADPSGQGGTGREEGYTEFDLTGATADSTEFTLQIVNLQPDATSQLIRGTAAVVLEGRELSLGVVDQPPVAVDVAGAAVILVEVHFVVATLTPQVAFALRQGADLLTVTSTAVNPKRVCVTFRENGPLGLQLLPGSRYFIFQTAANEFVPPMNLTFRLPVAQTTGTDPGSIKVFFRQAGNWRELSGAALAADQRSVGASTAGQNTFALSATLPS